jgi:hypothetical protein
MAMNARRLLDSLILEIGPCTFGHTYLYLFGYKINKENDITEVRNRISVANRCHFSLQKHFKSNFISRTTKILLHKTLMPPIVIVRGGVLDIIPNK